MSNCKLFMVFSSLIELFTPSRIPARGALMAGCLMMLAPGVTRADQWIYTDSLQPDWYNWTVDGIVDFTNSSPVHSGSHSVALLDSSNLLIIGRYPPTEISAFASLDFSLHGGTTTLSNTYLVLLFVGPVEPAEVAIFYLPDFAGNAWHDVTIPLTSPSLANRADFQGFLMGNYSQSHMPYYLDNIRLTTVPEPSLVGLASLVWLVAIRRQRSLIRRPVTSTRS
jgi:hypothetical protein